MANRQYSFHLRSLVDRIMEEVKIYAMPFILEEPSQPSGFRHIGFQLKNLVDTLSESSSQLLKSSYLTHLIGDRYSNLDVYRFTTRLGRHNSSAINFYSNASKLIEPMFSYIDSSLSSVNFDTYSSFGKKPFGYEDGVKYAYLNPESKSLLTEMGNVRRVPSSMIKSMDRYAIESCSLIPTSVLSEEIASLPKRFHSERHLFVSSENANVYSQRQVLLEGYDSEYNLVSESIVLNSAIPTETVHRYKVLTGISSTEDVVVRDTVDCISQRSIQYDIGIQKRICDKSGDYFEPKIVPEGNIIRIENSNIPGSLEVMSFEVDNNIDQLFLSNDLDIIYLSGGALYSSKLYYDILGCKQYTSTCNSNHFIEVDSEISHKGLLSGVTVEVESLLRVKPFTKISLSKLVNGKTFYYNNDSESWVEDESWIDISLCPSKLHAQDLIESNQVNYFLKTNTDSIIYESSTVSNYIESYKIAEGIDSILYIDQNLVAIIGENSFSIKPYRMVFCSDGEKLVFFNSFNNIQEITSAT